MYETLNMKHDRSRSQLIENQRNDTFSDQKSNILRISTKNNEPKDSIRS